MSRRRREALNDEPLYACSVCSDPLQPDRAGIAPPHVSSMSKSRCSGAGHLVITAYMPEQRYAIRGLEDGLAEIKLLHENRQVRWFKVHNNDTMPDVFEFTVWAYPPWQKEPYDVMSDQEINDTLKKSYGD